MHSRKRYVERVKFRFLLPSTLEPDSGELKSRKAIPLLICEVLSSCLAPEIPTSGGFVYIRARGGCLK